MRVFVLTKLLTVIQEGFLSALKALNPDVCVTAAYGNILPNKFLEIPQNGRPKIIPGYIFTLNNYERSVCYLSYMSSTKI